MVRDRMMKQVMNFWGCHFGCVIDRRSSLLSSDAVKCVVLMNEFRSHKLFSAGCPDVGGVLVA
jgi:hypothetical protein